jgi:hypothetical protein
MLPKIPRRNARPVMADPLDPDVEMGDAEETTFVLNERLARVRDDSVSYANWFVDEL